MGSELLTRRMDLVHTQHVDPEDNSKSFNILRMDTSYPVKLNGLIIKLFKATSNFSAKDTSGNNLPDDYILFSLRNAEESDETVVDIPASNVYSFDGKRLSDNEFNNGDYVMTIIDIANQSMFIFSLNNSNDDGLTTKHMTYHCNGKNDNVVLREIVNILVDMYDYSTEDIADTDYDIDNNSPEFNIKMTDTERREHLLNEKFTISIVGKWGTDYSNTTFVYGGFNRQNRSSIMSISGTNKDRDSEIEYDDDNFDNEIVLDWSKCYVPKIRRNNNEIYAALFNCIALNPDTNEWEQYDFWTKEYGKAHFTDEDGNAYGNLFPRRLAFLSIDGALPLNITIKGLTLSTFGIGIYIESESDKRVRIENCKITICNESYLDNVSIPTGDVNSDYYFFSSGYTPAGTAIDINSARAKVCIDKCDIKNGASNRHSNLIINSSSDTLITRTNVKDFVNMTNGYKNAYTTVCLDAEYFPEMYTAISGSETLTVSSNPEFAEYDFTNPNMQYVLLMKYSFIEGTRLPDNDPAYGVVPSKVFFGNDVNPYTNIQDLTDFYNIDTVNKSVTFKKMYLKSKHHPDTASYTIGSIKNIPILYRTKVIGSSGDPDYGKYIGLKNFKGESPVHDDYLAGDVHPRTIFNREYEFSPSLRISDSNINGSGILYQNAGQVIMDNCKLGSRLYDISYNPTPINLHSGTLTISNCISRFDTRDLKYSSKTTGWRGYSTSYNDPLSLIKVYPTINILKENNLLNSNDGSQVYDYLLPNGAAIPLTNARLNLVNSNLTLYPDYRFNIPNHHSVLKSQEDDDALKDFIVFSRVQYSSPLGNKLKVSPRSTNFAKNSHQFMTLSFINVPKENNNVSAVAPFNTRSFFNPITAPIINIDNCNFDIVNTGPVAEITTSPDNILYATSVRVGKRAFDKYALNLNYYINAIPDFETETITFNDSEYEVIEKSKFNYDAYSNFLNIIKYDMPENPDCIQNIRIYNLNGKIISLEMMRDLPDYYIVSVSSDKMSDVSGIDPNTDISRIISKIDILNDYGFYHNIARLNNDLSCEKDETTDNIIYTDPDTNEKRNMKDEDTSDHILISKLYEHDIINNALYTSKRLSDWVEDTHRDNLQRYKAFGVFGLVLNDCVLNMSNSSIGGPNGTAMRNTYNMETFFRRSPKIAFDLRGRGHYTINNVKAMSWSTVLWSQLFNEPSLDGGSNAAYKNIFDSTTLSLERNGGCNINNCFFINPSGVRFKNTQEDWLDFEPTRVAGADVNDNYSIYDKGDINYTLTGSSKTELRKRNTAIHQRFDTGNGYSSTGFAESIQNCNEMPIILVYNSKFNPVKIHGGTIIGNETIVLKGDIEFNGTTYINTSNAIMLYVGNYAGIPLSYIGNLAKPSDIVIKNCDIRCTKDVMWDKYVARRFGKDYNTNMYYYESCDDKGMNKYNNAISVIHMNNNMNSLKMTNNKIIFKPNSFRSMYGIDINSPVSTVYVHTYFSANKFINGYDNNTAKESQYYKPIIFNDNDLFMAFNCPHIPNSVINKVLPNSENISVIHLNYDIPKIDNSATYDSYSCTKPVIIKGNNFNVFTLIDKLMSDGVNSHRLGIINSKPGPDGSEIKVPSLYCYVPYEILLERHTKISQYTIDTGNSNKIDMSLDYNSMTIEEITNIVGGTAGAAAVSVIDYPVISIDMENMNFDTNKILYDSSNYSTRGNRTVCMMSGTDSCSFEDYNYNADKKRYENIQKSTTVDVYKDIDTGIVTITRGERTNTFFFNKYHDTPQIIKNPADINYNSTDETYVVASFNMPVLYSKCPAAIDITDNIFNSTINKGKDKTFLVMPAGEQKIVFGSNTIIDIESDPNIENFSKGKSSIINICGNTFETDISRNLRISLTPSSVIVNGYRITEIKPENIIMNGFMHNNVETPNIDELIRLDDGTIRWGAGSYNTIASHKSTFEGKINEGHIVNNQFHNIKISTDRNRCVGLKFNEYNATTNNLEGFALYNESEGKTYLNKIRKNINKDVPIIIDFKSYYIAGSDVYFKVLNFNNTAEGEEFYVAAKSLDSKRSIIKLKSGITLAGQTTNDYSYIVNISECTYSITYVGSIVFDIDIGTGQPIKVDRNPTHIAGIEIDGDAIVYLAENSEFLFKLTAETGKMSIVTSNYLLGDDISITEDRFKRGDMYKIHNKYNCSTIELSEASNIISLHGINSDGESIIVMDGARIGNANETLTTNYYNYERTVLSSIDLDDSTVSAHIYSNCVCPDDTNGADITIDQFIVQAPTTNTIDMFVSAIPIYKNMSSDSTYVESYGRNFALVDKFSDTDGNTAQFFMFSGQIRVITKDVIADADGHYVSVSLYGVPYKWDIESSYYVKLEHLCAQINAFKPFIKYVNEKTYFYDAINIALHDEEFKFIHDENNLNKFQLGYGYRATYLNNNEVYQDIKSEGIHINSQNNTFKTSTQRPKLYSIIHKDDVSLIIRSNLSDIYESII